MDKTYDLREWCELMCRKTGMEDFECEIKGAVIHSKKQYQKNNELDRDDCYGCPYDYGQVD